MVSILQFPVGTDQVDGSSVPVTHTERDIFYKFSNRIIDSGLWASLKRPAKSSFLCIAAHADANGKSFPSQGMVAELTGITAKQVRVGTEDLREKMRDTFHAKQVWNQSTGRNHWEYFLVRPKMNWFPLVSRWLKDGTLSKLESAAHSLYPVMRRTGNLHHKDALVHFTGQDAARFHLECPSSSDFESWFPSRPFDLCRAEVEWLMSQSGIKDAKTLRKGLRSLETHGLIREVSTDTGQGWLVNLWPHASLDRQARSPLETPCDPHTIPLACSL
ncbi:helix-turn-helix domain-containing protein [Fundidesulfovibrio putealis]|uniref:hypothetical protein n=1 Tax=Fundidesulfovibrio putealis TaxID=270496 RepID=UPI000489610C|nr:hypothetical protein [Fundidesulfovibrio putealis]